MSGRARSVEPEVPESLSIPCTQAQEISDWRTLQTGQLIELSDGQQGVLLSVVKTATEEETALRYVRVSWPKDGALPLGQSCDLSATAASLNGRFRMLGAWFGGKGELAADRVVMEAIYRGHITSKTCGVPWPLPSTWQLSAQAAEQIEQYLYEVARTTGCAFPFHDITKALCAMHLRLSPRFAGQLDILTGDSLGRSPKDDDEMLSMWARTLQQKLLTSDFAVPGVTPGR